MGAPSIVTNHISDTELAPSESALWDTVAEGDAPFVTQVRRPFQTTGGAGVFTQEITLTDPVTYLAPECDDPRVSFAVDSNDPTVVTVSFSSVAL